MNDSLGDLRHKRATLAFVLLFLLVAGVWCGLFTTAWFESPDAYEYAQMGREIVRGHGMCTKELFPRHIPYLQEQGLLNREHLPNLHRFPLPTLGNALAQLFVADPVKASVLQSGLWFLISIPLFFLLVRGLVDPALAFVCTVLYVLRPGIWASSYNGMSESLACLFLLLLSYVLLKPQASVWKYIGVGVSGALLFLARTPFAYAIVIALVYLGATTPKPERFRALAWSAGAFVLAMSPWMVRNACLTGNPLFSFNNSRGLLIFAPNTFFSDLEMQLHAPVGLLAVLREHGFSILAKFFGNLAGGTLRFHPAVGQCLLFVLAVIVLSRMLKHRQASPQYERFKWVIVALVAANVLVVSLVGTQVRYAIPLQPLLVIVVVQELFVVLERRCGVLARRFALFVLLAAGGACFAANIVHAPKSKSGQACKRLSEIVEAKSVVASDVSYKTALFCDVLSVRLPHHPAELLEIAERYLPIDYVVLSPRMLMVKPDTERSGEYYRSYREYAAFAKSDEFLRSFQLFEELPEGWLLYKRRPPSDEGVRPAVR
ncbi:MAG: hypothetical protein ABSE73_00970 [Planctomycetota bacterium]